MGERLRGTSIFFRRYGWWKARLDPVYPLVLAELRDGARILDLGAGMGLAEVLIANRFPSAHIRAVEWDDRKVRQALAVARGLPSVTVEQGDIREASTGEPDAILLLDVLHYLEPAEQRRLVHRCADTLSSGGLLLIRDFDHPRSRARAAERIERLAVRAGWNRGSAVTAWPVAEMAESLRILGFAVDVGPAGRGPFSTNSLLVGRKR